jgi:L-fuconolactonase
MIKQATATDFGHIQRFREDWLGLAEDEAVLEPDIPIVDTHIHLWSPSEGYSYFVEDYAREVRECGHKIDASIYVECSSMFRCSGPDHLRPVGETEFVVRQAALGADRRLTSSRVAAGIVAFADMKSGERLIETLDAHAAAAGGRLSGIRQRAKWDPDPAVRGRYCADGPGLYLQPEFQRGVAKLAARGLVFEASVYHPQLLDVVALARNAPDTNIVVVHSGSPVGHSAYVDRESEVRAVWLKGMTALARCPNVSIKMGGLAMSLAAFDFGVAAKPIASDALAVLWRPFIEPCVELFGPERCTTASNFPVDKVAFSYKTCWNMYKRIFASYSKEEKLMIFSETAKNIYRI